MLVSRSYWIIFLVLLSLGGMLHFHGTPSFIKSDAKKVDYISKKPNIILIIADDLGYSDISPYGNEQVITPNIQRLADEGMCFDNMFTSTAMCSPTRQQILTGLYPVRNGAYPNHSQVYEGTRSIVHYLRDAGYATAIIGKRDFGNKESFPFEFLGGRNMDYGKGKEMHLERAEKFIKQTHKPYFLMVASNQPHVPWLRGDRTAYPPEKIEVPEYMVDTKATKKALSEYYAEVTYLDSIVGQCLDMVNESGEKDNTIVIFTSEQGTQFPFAKWTCYDEGLKTNFIVRWPGHIPPKSRNSALTQYVDVVPTLLEISGVEPERIKTGNYDANKDQGLDGKSFRDVLSGEKKDFRDYVYGVQTTHGIINGSDSYPVRSVRNDQYLFIRNLNADESFSNVETKNVVFKSWLKKDKNRAQSYISRPAIELYNVKEDPYQLHNLAGNERYSGIVEKMNNALKDFMKQQGDEGLATEARAENRQKSHK